MAFGKEIKTQFGVDAPYWKIDEKYDSYRSKQLTVILRGYVDKDTADSRKSALSEFQIIIEQEFYKPDMTREEIYNHLKENTLEWSKAEFI